MYMIYHLTSHLNHFKYQRPETVKKRKSLSKQASKSELDEAKEEEEKQPELDKNSPKKQEILLDCTDCDMAFENKQVLGQHLDEIHF